MARVMKTTKPRNISNQRNKQTNKNPEENPRNRQKLGKDTALQKHDYNINTEYLVMILIRTILR